ncbi:redoxin domain-containing protein [Fimbriimonas ginsengisoli]|uniref:Redoxin domain protein n=1 Tax=Fimbriimonas ginsengisoli Gsoil 348 TaxID=661478 RepID=A0A068NVH9_FIMGI|nr:redoxin domain-containing protein [Fimbriimonas ginsengisoli]AIE87456.1 Redoxin domain protein [Fimbriimonas ginsengisoli Gsoil 348]
MLAALLTFPQLAPGLATLGFQNENGRWVAPLASKRPTVFFFILADCPIARQYSEEFKRLVHDYPSVSFYAVHADPSATLKVAKTHRREYRLPCPELLDPRQRLVRMAQATAVPTAALFSAEGRVKYSGRIDDRFPALGIQRPKPGRRDLRVALDEYLAGKPISVPRTPVVGCVIPKP